jgi:hypothetical protein
MKLKNKAHSRLSFQLRSMFIGAAALAVVVLIAIVIGINLSSPKVAYAASSCNLNQARNGTDSLPTNPMSWSNGNLGSAQAHYMEDWSAPFQCVMSGLTSGTQVTLTIGYDIRNSSKNAFDFLTHYYRISPHNYFRLHTTAETIDPLSGTTLASSTSYTTYAIPSPSSSGSSVSGQPTASFSALPASERVMTLYNGTIDSIYYVSQGSLSAASSETRVAIKFTPAGSTVVLLWGGHIATRYVWGWTNGSPNSAGGISGSPFHMRLVSWTLGNLGSTDRSISGAAVTNLSALLPITLSVFEAKAEGKAVRLRWATSSEINNDFFTIERSPDGSNFTSLSTVAGAGNSTSLRHYNFVDDNPLEGVSYYRLKQTDYDGKFSYSGVRIVNYEDKVEGLEITSIGPNPFIDEFTLNFSSASAGTAEVVIMRQSGKRIRSENIPVSVGMNSWHFSQNVPMQPGLCYAVITMNGKKVSGKIIKG